MCIKRQYELVRLGWLFFHANINSEATENQSIVAFEPDAFTTTLKVLGSI